MITRGRSVLTRGMEPSISYLPLGLPRILALLLLAIPAMVSSSQDSSAISWLHDETSMTMRHSILSVKRQVSNLSSGSPPAGHDLSSLNSTVNNTSKYPILSNEDDVLAGSKGRVCVGCSDSKIVQGISAENLDGKWIAFYCKHCAPHLSVRKGAQVPVQWPGISSRTGQLTMLPLYKRCFDCRRFATYGEPGPVRRTKHCKLHALPTEVDVVHKRKCDHQGCPLRATYSKPGAIHPTKCSKHKENDYVDVVHQRCRYKPPGGGRQSGCANFPLYGMKTDSTARMCWQHREPGMILLFNMRCRYPLCQRKPTHGKPTDKITTCCEEHKGPEDIRMNSLFVAKETSGLTRDTPRRHKLRYSKDEQRKGTPSLPQQAEEGGHQARS
uniref:Uncharacterized protein n=1 Tax=Guillardia theta TaxID=55529 RepID=A0A7S4KBH4_GUITH|mmetsp:Transcript_22582/g.74015  ORF Transcript_22582/g.74015 Transcript_22582/m.74015 type:complete len:384 (+) Transcript_22582:90-1241(+)